MCTAFVFFLFLLSLLFLRHRRRRRRLFSIHFSSSYWGDISSFDSEVFVHVRSDFIFVQRQATKQVTNQRNIETTIKMVTLMMTAAATTRNMWITQKTHHFELTFAASTNTKNTFTIFRMEKNCRKITKWPSHEKLATELRCHRLILRDCSTKGGRDETTVVTVSKMSGGGVGSESERRDAAAVFVANQSKMRK